MEADQSISQNDSQSSATEDHRVKSESLPGDNLFLTTQTLVLAPTSASGAPASSASSPQPIIPSTETNANGSTEDAASMPGSTKKKGTATPAAKKVPKRPKGGRSKKLAKKIKPEPSSSRGTPAGSAAGEDDEESDGSDDESDNGPYCICRGPDDHRWMICCEKCEDWFHGECIKLDKNIGESLIEKFICPNCTDDTITTLYQKTCALSGCRKPSRLLEKGGGPIALSDRSVFCSKEHAGVWWERLVAKLPKGKMTAGLSDQLTQDEFMALISHGLLGLDDEGAFRLASTPFKEIVPESKGTADDDKLSGILTAEEQAFLDDAANRRAQIAQETVLCHQMLKLIELAQERQRNAARAAKEDCCGYDSRLDTISSRDAFAAFIQSEEGQAIIEADELGDPTDSGATNSNGGLSMCERKRCKTHGGWQKILITGVRQQIKEMAVLAAELIQEENIVREAASERYLRKKAESNWVEVIEG